MRLIYGLDMVVVFNLAKAHLIFFCPFKSLDSLSQEIIRQVCTQPKPSSSTDEMFI